MTQTLSYDAQGRLAAVTDAFGYSLEFAYNSSGLLSTLTKPDGGTIQYSYTGLNLTAVTYPDGSAKLYHYENSSFKHYLTGVSHHEPGGATTRYSTFAYDGSGRAISTEHASAAEKYTFTYNSATQTTVADAINTQETLTFANTLGVKNLTSRVNQSDSKTLAQVFDSDNNLTCRKNEENRVTTYTYNATNQRVSMTEGLTGSCASPVSTAATRTTVYAYLSPDLDVPTVVTRPSVYPSGDRTTTLAYDDPSHPMLPTGITEAGFEPAGAPVSRSLALAYTGGQVTSIDGPRTDVADITTITYYNCSTGSPCGQIESVTNAMGHVTTYDVYDNNGWVTEVTDPNGLVTNYTYDDRGRVSTVVETPPSGLPRTTSYTYNAAGNLTTATMANGLMLTYTYNAAQQLTRVTDNAGNRIDYSYDAKGNRTSESTYDSSGNLRRTVTVAYDIRNHVASINAAGSLTQLVHDAVGNLVEETDPNSNPATQHDVDSLDRLIVTIDALSGVTSYEYDVNDRLDAVVAPNDAITEYVYDDLGNLLSEHSPDRGTTTYDYDVAGNVIAKTDARGITVTYAYDKLNRLTTMDYPGAGQDISYTYDTGSPCTSGIGRLCAMTDPAGTTSFGYDAFGNLISKSKVIAGNTHVTAYAYDDADQLESITYPSGRTVTYTRNVLGQITEVATTYASNTVTVADSITYEPFGPLKTLTFGNGLALSRTFDQQYRLTAQTTGTIQDLTFTHDAAGNIDAIADAVQSSLSQNFTQDALHRIDLEAGAYGTKDYTYDDVGNRLTRVHDDGSIETQTLTYVTDSNRLATHDGNTVTLDAAGNTSADPTLDLSFTYDDHNRMVEAYAGAVIQATYVYDGHGQRMKKAEATGAQRTIIYHYGLAGELIGETIYSSTGVKVGERDYLWLDSLPLAQSERVFSGGVITSEQFVYLHADQLETPRLATNGSGTVVWRWDSDAFGAGDADSDPDSDTNLVNVRLRFPGQYYDAETGLHYNYFRTYEPSTGRYLESDPIGLDGGLNTYGYALQNPLSFVDFFGQSPFKIIKLCAKGYKVVKEVGFREAVRAIRRGEDVLAPSTKQARKAANSASDANRATRDLPHQEDYMPHYHPKPRTGGHVFYSMAAALTLSSYVPEECNDECAIDEAASVLDFFNPLSAPQDIIDIYEMFREE